MAEIKIAADAGGGWTSLKGPASTSNQNAFVLPSADGSASQFLKTDGSKNLSFASAGITEFDNWRVTAWFSGSAEPITSNLERNDTAGFEKIGTGMSESSGVFSFPSTGKWFLSFYSNGDLNAATRWTKVEIVTTTNTGTDWVHQADGLSSNSGYSGNSSAFFSSCHFLFDVTNVSTHKCRFHIKQATANSSANNAGDSAINQTYMLFQKLGET